MTVLFQYLSGKTERLLPKILGAYALLGGQRMVAAQKHPPAIGDRAGNPLILRGIYAAINYRDINKPLIQKLQHSSAVAALESRRPQDRPKFPQLLRRTFSPFFRRTAKFTQEHTVKIALLRESTVLRDLRNSLAGIIKQLAAHLQTIADKKINRRFLRIFPKERGAF